MEDLDDMMLNEQLNRSPRDDFNEREESPIKKQLQKSIKEFEGTLAENKFSSP